MSTDTITFSEGSLLKVEMEVRLPVAATAHDIEAWLLYSMGHRGGVKLTNPLINHEAEPWSLHGFNWTYTGYVGRTETFDHEKTKKGETYRVRYIRERPEANNASA